MQSRLFLALFFSACVVDARPNDDKQDDPAVEADTTAADTVLDSDPPAETGDTDPPVDPPADSDEPPADDTDVEHIVSTTGLHRGVAWVRTHDMFVSGLIPHMPDAPADEVARYVDDFGANALHLWQDGLPVERNAWQSARPNLRWVSWLLNDGTSAENNLLLGGVTPNDPTRIGYQIGDEPRSWAEVAEIDAGIAAVRAADPDALIIINLGDPHEEGVEYADFAEHFAANPDVDVLSYDRYSTGYGEYERIEITRRAARRHDKAWWRYANGFSYVGENTWPHVSDMRWDAFVGLVYGYTGFTWFLYEAPEWSTLAPAFFTPGGTWSHTPNARFTHAAELNRQMATLGRSVSQLTSTDVRFIPATPLYAPDETRNWSRGAGGDPWITGISAPDSTLLQGQDTLVGFFTDDLGAHYVMLQNPHRESADWPLFIHERATFRIQFDFSSAPAALDTGRLRTLDKDSGAIHDLPLTSTGGSRATLEVELQAGDVLLFKYADGGPFAMR